MVDAHFDYILERNAGELDRRFREIKKKLSGSVSENINQVNEIVNRISEVERPSYYD